VYLHGQKRPVPEGDLESFRSYEALPGQSLKAASPIPAKPIATIAEGHCQGK